MNEDAFADLARTPAERIWEGVIGRVIHAERMTLAFVELDADSVVPEHSHHNEQVGLLLRGKVNFRVGESTCELEPGWTWRIKSGTPHEVVAGPEGAVLIEVFAPPRDDWRDLEMVGRREFDQLR